MRYTKQYWQGRKMIRLGLCIFIIGFAVSAEQPESHLLGSVFSAKESVLVRNECGRDIVSWQIDTPLKPASLVKFITAYYALAKWERDARFQTRFYVQDNTLWVQGLGDPLLVSEELDTIVQALLPIATKIEKIAIDDSYISKGVVPGHSAVLDPYNAPLSATALNFNTINMRYSQGAWRSAEAQTPTTAVAQKRAAAVLPKDNKAMRIHIGDRLSAQKQFAQVLAQKLGLASLPIEVEQSLPESAKWFYTHNNSRTVPEVVRAMMLFSNNFIANMLYLKLAENDKQKALSLDASRQWLQRALKADFGWNAYHLEEGAGLSNRNRLSAEQMDAVLLRLQPDRHLMKEYLVDNKDVSVFAKTGTLHKVQNLAGWIEFDNRVYRFVFLLNDDRQYDYRLKLLRKLVQDIQLNKQKYACHGESQL